MWGNPESGIRPFISFGIQNIIKRVESGIQGVESGIQGVESGIQGWDTESRKCNPESREWNPEYRKWNPESKDLLDYLLWGELYIICVIFLIVNVPAGKAK